ncbi:MAG: hypothetical protein JKX70_10920 [Phycisphaerales bacterium]|nr:hypothetical protein [Phycisphaerales bacterium]
MLAQLLIAISMLIFAQPTAVEPAEELKELLPGIRVGDGIVEFDGTVAIDCHHPDTPDVFLEMLVTAPDSREHESLVVASIKPSLLHAALLAGGFEPGSPITRSDSGKQVPAHGGQVQVLVAVVEQGKAGDFVPIEVWVSHIDSEKTLDAEPNWTGLVFAGSIIDKAIYAADFAGTLISLTSFGDEVIAPAWTISHQAEVNEPVWIANRDLVPKQGTPIRVRIEKISEASESHQPDRIDIDRDM